jgi:hypothetical protein
LTRALEKGGLADPANAHLLLGIASASDASWEEARKAFAAAAGYEKTEKAAREWLVEVEAEIGPEEVGADAAQPPTREPSGSSAQAGSATPP